MGDEEKNKKLEALEKMFGPKEIKKDPVEDTDKDRFIQEDAPLQKPETVKPIVEPVKGKTSPLNVVENESVKNDAKANTSKSFPLEKLKENLNPELKETLKKISNTVPKENITKLLNTMESNKGIVFDKGVTSVFSSLDPVEANILSKKMADWEVPVEASEVNASVIMAWLNKTKK